MSERSSTSSSSEPDDAEKAVAAPTNVLSNLIRVLGVAHDVSGHRIGIALRLRNSTKPPFICPMALTGRHHLGATENWLLEEGLDDVLSGMRVSEFGSALRAMAGSRKVTVVAEAGFHVVQEGDASYRMTAWDGHLRYFGQEPSPNIILTDDAAKSVLTAGSVKSWGEAFSSIAARNPRLTVALCFSFSAGMRRAFGEPSLSLILVAPTSTAKSTVQQVCASLTGKPEVVAWNATNQGMQEWLSHRPDLVACVEDLQQADKPEDILQVLMNTGNNAARLRAGRGKGASQARSIEATLILSSEKPLASLVSRASSGVLARCFEVHAGAHGMFDDPCEAGDPGLLANQLKQSASANYGAMWPKWLKVLSKSWDQVKDWHIERLPKLRNSILRRAGYCEPDELTGRLVNRLAFATFAGCVASELGLWAVTPQEVQAAFGLVLKEHLERQPPTGNALSAVALDAVRAYIETHRANFSPLSAINDPNVRAGLLGYTTDDPGHGLLFLFDPFVFATLFADCGAELLPALRSAGYLATKRTRHNQYEKKVATSDKGKRRSMFFIAVKNDIRYAPERK